MKEKVPKGFIRLRPYYEYPAECDDGELVAVQYISHVGDTWWPKAGVQETLVRLSNGKCVSHVGTVMDVVKLIKEAQK